MQEMHRYKISYTAALGTNFLLLGNDPNGFLQSFADLSVVFFVYFNNYS